MLLTLFGMMLYKFLLWPFISIKSLILHCSGLKAQACEESSRYCKMKVQIWEEYCVKMKGPNKNPFKLNRVNEPDR